MINVQNLLPFQKFRQKLANSDVTKKTLNRTASLVADSIVDAISFITGIVLWSENKSSPNLDLASARSEFLNPNRSGFNLIWNSQIRYNPETNKEHFAFSHPFSTSPLTTLLLLDAAVTAMAPGLAVVWVKNTSTSSQDSSSASIVRPTVGRVTAFVFSRFGRSLHRWYSFGAPLVRLGRSATAADAALAVAGVGDLGNAVEATDKSHTQYQPCSKAYQHQCVHSGVHGCPDIR